MKKTHGGKRARCGRPKLGIVPYNVKVKPMTIKTIKTEAKIRDVSQGKVIDDLAYSLAKIRGMNDITTRA